MGEVAPSGKGCNMNNLAEVELPRDARLLAILSEMSLVELKLMWIFTLWLAVNVAGASDTLKEKGVE